MRASLVASFGCLLALSASHACAQSTLEIGSNTAAGRIAATLIGHFETSDPSLLIVHGARWDDARLARAMRDGSLDLAIVRPLSDHLRLELAGMVFIAAALGPAAAGAGTRAQSAFEQTWIIHPQAPALDVVRFLSAVRSPIGQEILSFDAHVLSAPRTAAQAVEHH
jgi:hypothetical protein